MFDPQTVQSPADLPKDGPVVAEIQGHLRVAARRRLLYSFHWLREVALRNIEGELGLNVDADGDVFLQLSANGRCRRQVSLDERGWMRLQIFNRGSRELDLGVQVSVTAQVATPLPEEHDALVAAILGVHEAHWLKPLKSVEDLAGFQALDPWVRQKIEIFFGPMQSEADIARFLEGLRALVVLRDSINRQAAAAVGKKYEAEISYRCQSATQETALVDCSFDFTREGLRAFRAAWEGNFSWVLAADVRHIEVRPAALTSNLRSRSVVELHLPFLDRKEWAKRVESLANMEVASDGNGRLLVYHVEASKRLASKNSYQSVLVLAGGLSVGRAHSTSSFTLSYSDQRTLRCSQASRILAPALRAYGFDDRAVDFLAGLSAGRHGEVDVSLDLTVPGSLVSAWLEAPGERDLQYFPVYSKVSVTVQRALRLWLPLSYFSGIASYDTLETAFPLVVYQASRPFAGARKFELTYDAMSQQRMAVFFRMAAQRLPKELARVEELLIEAGKRGTAAFYAPRHARNILTSVQRRPKLIHSLVAADAHFVNALVKLGCQGHQLREKAAKDPARAVKLLSRF
ncbi:MAG: hypothetical protein EHM65_11095, partial [Acidobacteriales bacterium]